MSTSMSLSFGIPPTNGPPGYWSVSQMVLPAACVHKLVLRLQTVWSNQNKTNRSLNKQWLTSICSQRPFTICCLPVPKTWYQRKMDGWFEHHVIKATCVCVKSMYQQVLLLRLHHNVFNVLPFFHKQFLHSSWLTQKAKGFICEA